MSITIKAIDTKHNELRGGRGYITLQVEYKVGTKSKHEREEDMESLTDALGDLSENMRDIFERHNFTVSPHK